MSNNKYLGGIGEELAAKYLASMNMNILQRNYSCKTGEIDIIAADEAAIVFVEVKTRSSEKYGKPSEAVSITKQTKIIKTALWYLSEKQMFDKMSRFDVIEIYINEENKRYKVNYIKDAFQYNGRYGY